MSAHVPARILALVTLGVACSGPTDNTLGQTYQAACVRYTTVCADGGPLCSSDQSTWSLATLNCVIAAADCPTAVACVLTMANATPADLMPGGASCVSGLACGNLQSSTPDYCLDGTCISLDDSKLNPNHCHTTYQGQNWVAPAGVRRVDNPCQSCQIFRDGLWWLPLADGTSCGSGQTCGAGMCGGMVVPDAGVDAATAADLAVPADDLAVAAADLELSDIGMSIDSATHTDDLKTTVTDQSRPAPDLTVGATTCTSGLACGNFMSNTPDYCENGVCLTLDYTKLNPNHCHSLFNGQNTVQSAGFVNPNDDCQSCQVVGAGLQYAALAAGTSCAVGPSCVNGVCAYGVVDAAPAPDFSVTPDMSSSDLANGATVIALAAGDSYSCALLQSGAVNCWGVTQALTGAASTPTPTAVNLGTSIGAVEIAGGAEPCVRLASGAVRCWGQPYTGPTSSPPAYQVVGISSAAHLSGALGVTNLALLADSTAVSWPAQMPTVAAAAAGSVTNAVEIRAGSASFCARRGDGTVACWGSNGNAELGTGMATNTNSKTAVNIPGITDAIDLAFASETLCVLHAGGTVTCWGENSFGQIGNGTSVEAGTSPNPVAAPQTVQGLTDAIAIVAGDSFFCALRATHTVVCWGDNSAGALGDGTTTDRSAPVAVVGLTNVLSLAAGYTHNCALRQHDVMCWGHNLFGEVGVPATGSPVLTPTTAITF